jgi:hypothetical protein
MTQTVRKSYRNFGVPMELQYVSQKAEEDFEMEFTNHGTQRPGPTDLHGYTLPATIRRRNRLVLELGIALGPPLMRK